MSLDRSHPVFLGHRRYEEAPLRFRSHPLIVYRRHDQIAPIFRGRSLDDEIGSRAFKWKYRRYFCILGDPGCGKRTLARRFFQDRGELRVDGSYWLRGLIHLTVDNHFTKGELDLLIRIIPSKEELAFHGREFHLLPIRILAAVGIHCDSSLFIFAFDCSRLMHVYRSEPYYLLLSRYTAENLTPFFFLGTRSDRRSDEWGANTQRCLDENDFRGRLEYIYREVYNIRPQYIECSAQNNVNVHTVINKALQLIT